MKYAILLIVLTLSAPALAVGKPDPVGHQEQTGYVSGYQEQSAAALAGAQSDAAASAGAYGQGGTAGAAARGGAAGAYGQGVGSVSSAHRSSSFLFASDLPGMAYCASYIGVGGGNDSGAGFLQVPIIRHSIWMQCLAAAERSVEIQARLKCADRKYRNALVYYLPRRDRQGQCIGLVRDELTALVAHSRQAAGDALAVALATARLACDENLGRCEAAVRGGK